MSLGKFILILFALLMFLLLFRFVRVAVRFRRQYGDASSKANQRLMKLAAEAGVTPGGTSDRRIYPQQQSIKAGTELKGRNRKPRIACLPNGPYYLLNEQEPKPVDHFQNSRGEPLACVRGVALCRCGGSSSKPFCDGTHGTNGFTSKKMTDGSLDRRKSYAGKNITIHDNRGICAHAGHCTEAVPSVFRLKAEPWIDADGGAREDIIASVRQCPSGALSYSIDSIEHRDQDREPMVTIAKDGPYCVTGGIELMGEPRGEGASLEHYTLCRCGGSKNKPFCDGTHWHLKFKDEKN